MRWSGTLSFSTKGWTRGTTFWSTKRLNASTTRCAILLRSSARGFRVCAWIGRGAFFLLLACDQGRGGRRLGVRGSLASHSKAKMAPAILVRHVIHHPALVLPKWNVLDRLWECAVVIARQGKGGRRSKKQQNTNNLLLPRFCLLTLCVVSDAHHGFGCLWTTTTAWCSPSFPPPPSPNRYTGQRRPRLDCLSLCLLCPP